MDFDIIFALGTVVAFMILLIGVAFPREDRRKVWKTGFHFLAVIVFLLTIGDLANAFSPYIPKWILSALTITMVVFLPQIVGGRMKRLLENNNSDGEDNSGSNA